VGNACSNYSRVVLRVTEMMCSAYSRHGFSPQYNNNKNKKVSEVIYAKF
jgi:hypothetical protein